MGSYIKDIFRRIVAPSYKPIIHVSNEYNPNVTEKFKGEIVKETIKFPEELGEEHPFDYLITEGLYKKFGLVTGVIDKYIDFERWHRLSGLFNKNLFHNHSISTF